MEHSHRTVEMGLALLALVFIALSAVGQFLPKDRRRGMFSNRARGFFTAAFMILVGLRMSLSAGLRALHQPIEAWDLTFIIIGGVGIGVGLCVALQLASPSLLTGPYEATE